MPRKKPSLILNDLMEVNTAMAEASDLDRRIGLIELRLNERVDQLKAEADAELAPLAGRRVELDLAILDYAERRKKSLFSDVRSQDLSFGILRCRAVTKLAPLKRWTWKAVLGRLIELNTRPAREAIKTKQEVDREVLERWTDDRLAEVGVQRVRRDVISYELTVEQLGEVAS